MAVTEPVRWHGVYLDPLDVLLFRDGRPFDATNRVLSDSPTPRTLAGAVRSALLAASGFDFGKVQRYQGDLVEALRRAGADEAILQARLRGPWLARAADDGGMPQPLFACPVNLRCKKGDKQQWMVARPLDPAADPLPGWNHPDGLWPLRFPEDPDPKFDPVLLTVRGLQKFFLAHHAAATAGDGRLQLNEEADYVRPEGVRSHDHRIGIQIDPASLTTVQGQLYGIGMLALQPRHGLYLEIELPDALAGSLNELAVPLGGEGRCAQVRVTAGSALQALDAENGGGRTITYLATPTFLRDRNYPGDAPRNRPLPPESCGQLRAAASDRPLAVSGWDVARGGPRATRFAVPAGAVYFFDTPPQGDLIAELDDKAALVQEGWGFTIQGSWE